MGYRRYDTKRAHANTCDWITRHQSYTTWLEEGSGILWIKGKPGSGKSTLMEYLLRDFEKQARYQKSIQLSFFLHGRGTRLQKSRLGMFRSLLHQLLLRAPATGAAFQRSFEEKLHSQGEPGKDWDWHINEIYDFFISAVEDAATTQSVNIFVDALDEADDGTDDRNTSRQIVDDFHEINDILYRKKLHSTICFSCRHYPVTKNNQKWEIWVENENHEDISTYICDELEKKLSAGEAENQYLMEWQDTIIKGAQGVFQWAALVVGMVVQYYDNGMLPREIRQMLAEVPEGLSDVYKHILKDVVEGKHYRQTLRLMRCVYLAERPLTMAEICFAMNLPDTETFDSELDELELPTHNTMRKRVMSLSGGLIEFKQHENQQILQFIHQSVNDFLLRDGLEFLDTMSRGNPIGLGHHQLSLICANYIGMIKIDYSKKPDKEAIQAQFPFVDYAVRSWYSHAEKAETQGAPQDYLLRFIQYHPYALKNWIWLYKIIDEYNLSGRRPENNSTLLHIASGANILSVVNGLLEISYELESIDDDGNRALHYASRWGHVQIVKKLLDTGALIDEENKNKYTPLERAAANGHREVVEMLLAKGANVNKQTGNTGNALYGAARKGSRAVVRILLDHKADINAQGGEYGNALQAAALEGHQSIVQLLLDHKADINAQDGEYGNALQAAAFGGHQSTIHLLLDYKADINAQGGRYGNALQAAAFRGHQSTVQLLLDHKANIDAQGGRYGSALQAAAFEGHQSIVQLLLDHKADINAQDGEYGNALQAAAFGGHQSIVQLLLDHKANINAQGGEYGNALQAAAFRGHQSTVQLLLDHKANINAQGGEYGNALQAATCRDHQSIIQLLLDHKADINAQGGEYGNALQAAVLTCDQSIIQLLLDYKADVNAQGGPFGNALQAAVWRSYQPIIQLFLDYKADVNAQGGPFGNALQAAVCMNNQSIVQLLLDHKANIDAQGGEYGSALQASAFEGHQSIVQLLLDHKADISVQGGRYGNTLQAAALGGHQSIVQLLLDYAQGGEYGNALQAAALGGHQSIVQLLLDYAQGGEYGSALQAAALGGHQSIVQLLLDHKADVNTQGGEYGSALQAAAFGGHQSIVQLLLDYKADVNAQGGEYGNALQAAALGGHRSIVQLLVVETKLHLLHPNFLPINSFQIQNISTKVQFLLNRGLEIRDFHNNVISGNKTAIISALDNGIKTDVPGGYYIYALHTSVAFKNLAIVSLLVERSSTELNFKDQYGRTPLWLAAREGYVEIVEYLLKHKADPSISDDDGITPLMVALQKKQNLVVEVIRKYQGSLIS
jgi:ankyrin repeat protein